MHQIVDKPFHLNYPKNQTDNHNEELKILGPKKISKNDKNKFEIDDEEMSDDAVFE